MLNFIAIAGRLTKDPELRYTQNNTAVAAFTVAVDADRKAADGSKGTDFFNCVAWRQKAEFVSKYFAKGQMAIVTGRLTIREYTDKNGNKRSAPEIVVGDIYFGETKKKEEHTTFTDLDDDSVELPY